MDTYKVGIYSRDPDYSRSFMGLINSDGDRDFRVAAFSEAESIKKYLENGRLDLLLSDDISIGHTSDGAEYFEGVRMVFLSDQKEVGGYNENTLQISYIYKYQTVSSICKEIRRVLAAGEDSGRNISEIIGIYSPISRCGKTRFAKTLAGYDEVRGGLYVGMEDFSDDIASLTANVLYPLKMKRSDLESEIVRLVRKEQGICKLYVSGTYMDTNDVSCQDIELLKEVLLKTGSFTTICFDIGSAALGDFSILRCFKHIYMPVLRDEISMRKIEVFMKLLADLNYQDIIRMLIPVDLPDAEAFSEEMIKTVWKVKNGDVDGR